MSEVFLCERGQLTDRAKHDLRKAGVVVVEVDDPAKCQFIRATETIPADDMLWAALSALKANDGSYSKGVHQREIFTVRVFDLLDAARRKP